MSDREFFESTGDAIKRLLTRSNTSSPMELSSSQVLTAKKCPPNPENKSKYSIIVAKAFLAKLCSTGIGKLASGATKRSVTYSIPAVRPRGLSKDAVEFLDNNDLLMTLASSPRKRAASLERQTKSPKKQH